MSLEELTVDCAFPGGNIVVDHVAGDRIELHQDVRDTTEDWFYWHFRLSHAAGRTVRVQFTGSDVIGVRGPAMSQDHGQTWRWLGRECVRGNGFEFIAPLDAECVHLSMGMPYQQSHLERFVKSLAHKDLLQQETLCVSRYGRPVESLLVGSDDHAPPFLVVVTARHHACEMMANYVVEGLIQWTLDHADSSESLLQQANVWVIPFVDKDGVEQGDQGKCRRPHDHNRDYVGQSIYPEVAAIRKRILTQYTTQQLLILDLHCPMLKHGINEVIYFVGSPEAGHKLWANTLALSAVLERSIQGSLPFESKNGLPFGIGWNTLEEGMHQSLTGWAASTAPNVKLANIIEIPYANAAGAEVNAGTARAFGADLARAIGRYLSQSSSTNC